MDARYGHATPTCPRLTQLRIVDDYLAVNAANWDARADAHMGPGGYRVSMLDDPAWLSSVVRFDRPRLGDVRGLDGLHLQCHLGTDTISLARLGARMTGVDLSSRSLEHARVLAERAGAQIDYVQADVSSAPTALGGRTFDLVYTGIGALCWLPDIRRWGQTVAQLLRPGGRLFVRDAHPVLNSVVGLVVRDHHPDRDQQPGISGPGAATPALELCGLRGNCSSVKAAASAANPTPKATTSAMHHHGERVENSLMRSTASSVMAGSLPPGRRSGRAQRPGRRGTRRPAR